MKSFQNAGWFLPVLTVSGITVAKGLRSEQASHFMKSTRRPDKTLSAEQIARIAERAKDVSNFFTNTGT